MSTKRQKTIQKRAMKKNARSKAIVKAQNVKRYNSITSFNTNKRFDTAEEMTAKNLLSGIHQSISVIGPVHGAIEVLNTLIKEGKLEPLSEEEQNKVIEFDAQVVRLGEEINLIETLITAGQEPSSFPEIAFSLINNIDELTTVKTPEMTSAEGILGRNKEPIDEFIREHLTEGEDFITFGLRFSDQRMAREAHKYVTKLDEGKLHEINSLAGDISDISEMLETEEQEPEVFKVQDVEEATPFES